VIFGVRSGCGFVGFDDGVVAALVGLGKEKHPRHDRICGVSLGGGVVEFQLVCQWLPVSLVDDNNYRYTSKFRTSLAWVVIKRRRGDTSLPISMEKVPSVVSASSIVTCNKVRMVGSMVVSHNC